MLSVAELKIGLPSCDDLWLANDGSSWHQVWSEAYGSDGQAPPPVGFPRASLPELFHMLLEDRLGRWSDKLEILPMRLLLYPIQSLVSQVCEIRPLLSTARSTCRISRRPLCETSTALRVEETKDYLRRWLEAYAEIRPKGLRQQALSQGTLIIFNLISLNLCISIPGVERFARELACGNNRDADSVQEIQAFESQCIESREEALLHCGQILSIVRGTAPELRPLWCPLAIYRVAITLWALGISSGEVTQLSTRLIPSSTREHHHFSKVAIDTLPSDHLAWRQFLRRKIGNPCVTAKNGDLIPINDTQRSLSVCTELIEAPHAMSPLAEGVIYKLKKLAAEVAWSSETTRV